MSQSAFHAAAFAFVACLPLAAHAGETLTGAHALPDGGPKVSATLVATSGWDGAETLNIAMTATGQQRPVTKYETELSKQLHVIAVSGDFRTFMHECADRATPAAAPDTGGTGTPVRPAGHHGMAGMEAPGTGAMPLPLRSGARVPADLTLHVLAPKVGTYLLWIQFTAGSKVRTMPFDVAVS